MARATKIMRRSIYTFLQNYQYLTATAAILALPYSASILLSQTYIPSSSLLQTTQKHLNALFQALGFLPSSQFSTFVSLKLSQTLSIFIFSIPFSLSFNLLAKCSVIRLLHDQENPSSRIPFASVLSVFNPLLVTYLCNALLIVSANATVFAFLFFSVTVLEGFGFLDSPCFLIFSVSGAILYSIILANLYTISNFALTISGMERSSGFSAILRSFVLLHKRSSTALKLAVPVNVGLVAIDALFNYRIVARGFYNENPQGPLFILEGMFISYLYSLVLVLDSVVSCVLYKACKSSSWMTQHEESKGLYAYRIEIPVEDIINGGGYLSLKVSSQEV